MTPAQLKAAHDDVLAIGRLRRPLPSIPGLNDSRAVLHAHAEDLDHTDGTRGEMLADAKRADVYAILLTDHFRPPKDFVADSWYGLCEGVVFLPGSEDRGFLTSSIPMSYLHPREDIWPIIWPSGMPRHNRAGSPALPRTTATTTRSRSSKASIYA
jgi:hypothetical protein